MTNMSYCRLENTFRALQECEGELLMTDEDFAGLGKSDYEARARRGMIERIIELAEELNAAQD